MEVNHLRGVDDEIPSSPIAYAHERNTFCITNTSQNRNLDSNLDNQNNISNTDIETAVVVPSDSFNDALLNRNLSNYNNQIILSQEENSHVSLKKRLKSSPVTFKPFESFRALEETVRELNCFFQSEYKKSQNSSSQSIEKQCPKFRITVK